MTSTHNGKVHRALTGGSEKGRRAGVVERKQSFRHPNRFTVRGGSGRRASELADRLVELLSSELRMGHVRGAVNGTDSSHGHKTVVASSKRTVISESCEHEPFEAAFGLLDCDALLEEGIAGQGAPAVLLFDDVPPPPIIGAEDVIATVGGRTKPKVPGVIPHFESDDLQGLAGAVKNRLDERAKDVPLYGLVLAGGRSRRMGRPKWAIEYHGEPQALSLHKLLSQYCQKTFLSLRAEQTSEPALAGLPSIADRFLDMGPLGGILSAMSAHPEAAWLVSACDLPFVGPTTVETLLSKRRPLRFATSFISPHDGMPEPLCAVYEPKARLRLFQAAALGFRCPRKMLVNSRIELVESAHPEELTNANDPQEFKRAVARLKAGGLG